VRGTWPNDCVPSQIVVKARLLILERCLIKLQEPGPVWIWVIAIAESWAGIATRFQINPAAAGIQSVGCRSRCSFGR
jgi:hypothetical protein